MEKTSNILAAEVADDFAIWEIPAGKDPASDFGLALEDDDLLTAQVGSNHD